MILNEQQQDALNSIISGENVFLTGPAGSGKSFILNTFIKYYEENKKGILYKTSMTGISALLINGITLHRFAGIGIASKSVDYYISKIFKNQNLKERWQNTDVLIIDEISMLTLELFEKLELIARKVRRNEKPFGGIQLILSGDFFQLPPIDSKLFCFESNIWNTVIKKTFYFEIIMRQTDNKFQSVLNKIRVGNIDSEVKEVLNSCLNKDLTNELGIEPTILLSTKLMVKNYNDKEQQKLVSNETIIFKSKIKYENINDKLKETYLLLINKAVDIDNEIKLSIGTQVMLIINKPDDNLANGSLGKIIKFEDGYPIVLFLNGIEKKIKTHIWSLDEDTNNKINILKEQIPLIPAWAITIHRAQGSTLEYVLSDIGNSIFEYGQVYVVLSRLKNLEGLSLLNINFNKIIANPKVIKYYNNLQ